MKVKFANGVEKECSAPTEQKAFRNVSGQSVGIGWILNIRLLGGITSSELDNLLATDNIKTLEFVTNTDNETEKTLFTLDGYEKVTSSSIRHAEDISATFAEIQLTKGI
jgi:hypothetical protein